MTDKPKFWLAKKMTDLLLGSEKPEKTTLESESKVVSETRDELPKEEPERKPAKDNLSGENADSDHYPALDIAPGGDSASEALANSQAWSNELASAISKIDLETYQSHSLRGEYFQISAGIDSTVKLSAYLYKVLSQLSAHFNDSVYQQKSSKRVRLTITEHTVHDITSKKSKSLTVSDFRITSATRSLSVRSEPGKLYAYLLPANTNLDLEKNETTDRLKLALVLDSTGGDRSWTINGLPVSEAEIIYLAKALIRDLVILSCLDYLAYDSGKNFEHVDNIHRVGIARGFKDSLSLQSELGEDLVKDLVFAQQNTVQKLLRQQEEIQASIARDLHDTVLADIMMLERRLTSKGRPNKKMILETLEEISITIREICQGLVPRDLKDWGLETVLEDLVDKAAERLEADFSFSVEGNIPDLPSAVQLHIFRIIQEALNNIEKYSEAKNVSVVLAKNESIFTITVEDDGRGFDTEKEKQVGDSSRGGFGLPSISERLEIIRAYYPARIKLNSEEGKGTTLKIEITVDAFS